MNKLIILGGSGYVGRSIIDYLNSKKTQSRKIKKIIIYSRKGIKIEKKNKIEVVNFKKNLLKLKKLPEIENIIYCINSNNLRYSNNCFKNFKYLLSKSSLKRKILFISSGAVYGPRKVRKKFSENENLSLNKINKFNDYKKKYALEKLFMENEFKKLGKSGYNASIARCFTFYGRHILKYNYAISEIINTIVKKKKLNINNHKLTRSYMHADDLSAWLLKIIKNSSKDCPIYNVGSDKPIILNDLMMELAKKYNNEFEIKKTKYLKSDFYVPSTKLAKKKLKLKITIDFKDAINLLIHQK